MKRKTKGIIKLTTGIAIIASMFAGIGVSTYRLVDSNKTIAELDAQYTQTQAYEDKMEQRDARLAFIDEQLDSGEIGQREYDDEKEYYASKAYHKDVLLSLDESGMLKQAYTDNHLAIGGILFPALLLGIGGGIFELCYAMSHRDEDFFFQSAINDIKIGNEYNC